jgi:large subunit ribosomal protein L22
MEARCVAKYLRIAPRKMRLVADLVRGKNVNEAISLLKFTPKSAARPTLKAIQSAVANIVNKDDKREVDPDSLVVRTIFVDEGPSFKRYLPRAMGRATPIIKRMSHLTVWVAAPVAEEPEVEVAPATEMADAKPSPAKKKAATHKRAAAKAKVSKGTKATKTPKKAAKAKTKKAK